MKRYRISILSAVMLLTILAAGAFSFSPKQAQAAASGRISDTPRSFHVFSGGAVYQWFKRPSANWYIDTNKERLDTGTWDVYERDRFGNFYLGWINRKNCSSYL